MKTFFAMLAAMAFSVVSIGAATVNAVLIAPAASGIV